MAGYCKAIITLFKYLPQVYLNYSRKSTVGWSIFNIMCDFTGGVFSIAQEVVDMSYVGMTTGVWSFFGSKTDSFNIVKFFLGIISIVFDIIFMVQHFYLYPDKNNELTKLVIVKNSSQKSLPTADTLQKHMRGASSISTNNARIDSMKIMIKENYQFT